ncbi:hypothetical protein [Aequorivita xiaoshiensis]|uniref:Selenophosphate synthetase n=1 Tax=Aequorivita xiaoshiensis TaxID=2874476 RepID=A0A9X1QYD8_9FLAO|nr:hypothetical protein [Aequorivita xiaoshiensis]MCG2430911.1 hypothetical protein [Aequorivita xiaoshiensis]
MKNTLLLLLFTVSLTSCKNNNKSTEIINQNRSISIENLSTAEKIANASGYKNWKDVSEIAFTFNVNRGNNHFYRAWTWNPKSGDVTMTSANDTISYNRSQLDSLNFETDAAFINDKYWLLTPFQLKWDENITISEKKNIVAPISKDTLNQISIVYGSEGGYTPGDAYDFFYDEDFKIREWNYRKGNAEIPSLSTTWEDYENFNGIEIAKTYKDSTDGFKLYFTDISVKK